jgi:DNA-binding GntR family transcriptional regulator
MQSSSNPLHERVAQILREQIFSGQLAPGTFLDEHKLCGMLEISRTPLREALKVLSAEGLLRHEPRRGCFVNQITEQDLDDIFPVIALLEGRCAYDAARHANDADLVALGMLHEDLQGHAAASRVSEYYATNFVIHEAIISLAQNRWLTQSIADLRKILKLSRLQSLGAKNRLNQSLEEHMAIFEALKNRDSDGAQSAMRLHLTRQRDALREIAREQRKFPS